MQNSEKNALKAFELFLPKNIFEWFDVVNSAVDENNIYITLQEKDLPPTNEKVAPKGFKEITITDFPIRGKRTLLTFKRRYWQIKGCKEYLKRDIKLNFPGTQLEKEFADFLKEDGGRKSGLTDFYRRVSSDPSQRI